MQALAFLDSFPNAIKLWLVLSVTILVAIIVALALHRAGIAVLRRVLARRPYLLGITSTTFRASQSVVALLALRLVLSGAPDNTPHISGVSQLATILLIIALTWLALRSIHAISETTIRLNPYDISDNLRARRLLTQTRVLARSANAIVALVGLSFVLLSLPGARQIGASLLASAGVAGLVAGIAARPVLGNFIAGLQIAFTQPIRIDDVLIVEDEWGRVEEITAAFVVLRIWDERRLIIPLQWFIENPFQNWTHRSASLLGTVFLWLDFSVPLDPVRQEFEQLCKSSAAWDGRVRVVQVTDTSERSMQVRFLVSAGDSGKAFDLRCFLRENLIAYIVTHYPGGLPRVRADVDADGHAALPETRPQAEEGSSPAP